MKEIQLKPQDTTSHLLRWLYQKRQNKKCGQGHREMGKLILLAGIQNATATSQNILAVSLKVSINLSFNSAIPLLGVQPRKEDIGPCKVS